MVTSSSAEVGWMPTVESSWRLVRPIFIATPKPCMISPALGPTCSRGVDHWGDVNDPYTSKALYAPPHPHPPTMWMPSTRSEGRCTMIFMNARPSLPLMVLRMGLKEEV